MFGRKKEHQKGGTFAEFHAQRENESDETVSSADVQSEIQLEDEEVNTAESLADESMGTEGTEAEESSSTASEEQGTADHNIRELQTKLAEGQEKYIRLFAELENLKKRHAKERQELLRYAGEHLARDLLEVVDNLELALKQPASGANEDFVNGVRLIHTSFQNILEKHSVRGESSLSKPFDPTKHEALASVPMADSVPGTIIEEFKKAYFFKDKLLRPAQVVVSAPPVQAAEPSASPTESETPKEAETTEPRE